MPCKRESRFLFFSFSKRPVLLCLKSTADDSRPTFVSHFLSGFVDKTRSKLVRELISMLMGGGGLLISTRSHYFFRGLCFLVCVGGGVGDARWVHACVCVCARADSPLCLLFPVKFSSHAKKLICQHVNCAFAKERWAASGALIHF